jgi:hypothetical protein
VHNVSLWDGPDVGPLARIAPAFIAEKTRRLTTPLTGDVPLQHLGPVWFVANCATLCLRLVV